MDVFNKTIGPFDDLRPQCWLDGSAGVPDSLAVGSSSVSMVATSFFIPIVTALICWPYLRKYLVVGFDFILSALQPRPEVDDDDDDDGNRKEKNKPLSQREIWAVVKTTAQLARPEAFFIVAALTTSALQSLAGIYKPVLQGHAVDFVTSGAVATGGSVALLPWVLKLGGIALFQALCEYVRPFLSNNIGDHVRQRAQEKFFRRVLHNEVGYFDGTHSSRLSQAYYSLHSLHHFTGHQIPQIIEGLFTLVFTIVYMFRADVVVAGTVACFMFLVFVVERNFRNYEHFAWVKMHKVERKANQFREECFGNVRVIKRFSCEAKQQAEFENLLQQDSVLREELVHTSAMLRCIRTGMMALAGLIAWTMLSMESNMSMGDVTAFVALLARLWSSTKIILGVYGETVRSARSLKKAYDVMDRNTLIPHQGGKLLEEDLLTGCIEFKEVSFSYPTGEGQLVLDDVNLTLPAGKVTALCGSSGGGKSTVASLVLRDYDPKSGGVYLDGVNIASLDLTSYHQHTAVVSQEPTLFATTLRDNIAFGAKHEVSQKDVERAAKLANAHDFIMGFKKGYDTQVGERGVRLSGGQKQRIAIARAILIDPKILVLDESTSALDAKCERVVQDALDTIMVGRTTLVIAHRLSTIKGAHNIVVIHKGKVVEEGTHADLLAKSGHYAILVKEQLNQAPPDGSTPKDNVL